MYFLYLGCIGWNFAAVMVSKLSYSKKTHTMTTQEIATKLAEFCTKGEFEKAQQELYADNVVSIEPEASPAFAKETNGLPAVKEKMSKFMGMVEEVFKVTVSEPLVTGNAFAFTLDMDIAMKGRERETMSEVCVYVVKDGKVVSEQFFM
jgi:hypothetical protein